jgi:hypothetical protein
MEKLLGAQKLQILDHAEHELSEYCSNIKSKKERQKCFEVGYQQLTLRVRSPEAPGS